MTTAAACNTLALDRTVWDLTLDSAGDIAMAEPPYAQAQDMASAIRTFVGEAFYNTALGALSFDQDLDRLPPASLLRTQVVNAALTVPGVTSAQAFFNLVDRVLLGQVQGSTAGATVVATTAPSATGGPFILNRSILGGPDVLG